jgi:hypothetical protein
MDAWGGSFGTPSAWGGSFGDDSSPPVDDAVFDGGSLRRLRRRQRPAKLHPEEIARQQREEERYLRELADRSRPSAPTPAKARPAPIAAEVGARAEVAVVERLEEQERIAREQRRRRHLLLLMID